MRRPQFEGARHKAQWRGQKEMPREVKKVQLPRTWDFEICIFLKLLISKGEDKVYEENIKTGKRKLRKTLDDA